jgi:ABC-2 type transport system permease protein
MLADAIAAENLRLTRNRATFFWGFLFVPLLALVAEIIGRLFMHAELPAELRVLPVDMADQLVEAFGGAGGPMTVLLSLIGAAVLFAGDYRWETWRLLTPRASRTSLFLAKAITFAGWALVTVILIGVLDAMVAWIGGLMDGSRMTFEMQAGAFVRQLLAVTLVSWVQLLFAGGLAALAATATRSMIAAIMVPIGAFIGLFLLQNRYPVVEAADEGWKILLIPGHALDYGRVYLAGIETLPGQTLAASVGLAAVAGMLVWLLIGFGGGLAIFLRQDLSKE